MNNSLPFTISKTENFYDRLGDYIGDVFYDILPEKGYELRDEQIYMAYQLEKAFKNKSTIFAEAGVGTGKTFVYLLYALCYARYMGKPAIISCADETLIEQLVKEQGDIQKLEEALSLNIDVRLAKAREQYVCVKKLDQHIQRTEDQDLVKVYDKIPDFVYDSASLLSFYHYGDRKEYPWINNEKWASIAWDPLQKCATCDWHHRCGQTLTRHHYRDSADLIICSHDFYMEHIWTKESRKREGQLPLLPDASCVVFDEGHLLEFSAQKGLTYRFHEGTLHSMLTNFLSEGVREESLYLIEDILELHEQWFDIMHNEARYVEGSNRKEVPRSKDMIRIASSIDVKVQKLLEQLVFDSELYIIEEYYVKMIEEYLEFLSYGLSILLKDNEGIFWLEGHEEDSTLVIMPRLVETILRQEVFSQKIPFVFSSATLSQAGDFSYIASSLGIEQYASFTVASPFDYEENMKVLGHTFEKEEQKWSDIIDALKANGGRSLVLFTSIEEMNRFRVVADTQDLPFDIVYEGDREISDIVRDFQTDHTTVLCSFNLWEGLDVPGESLTQVIVSSLPFPPHDPVFQAKRQDAHNPTEEVDVPYMLLRLRQGVGRLIRTSEDFGKVHIWMTAAEKRDYLAQIEAVLPVGMEF
ncbi:ATP-dependent DNA helicase [Bacillus sp. HMF5848]|uniref:ATP-dependent DNA helicase n=1 Tax=Bacillus sp. HMF5848 TaxID=2495421 RepID=UPI000F79461F|nr:ATP-dependent DNA helicase [Bacillus sp. HMF5848]RSK28881.1 ATP-dependent DNA helicase [Bacillus sp. HMF5848]